MGLNWKKIGQFATNVSMSALESSAKQQQNAIKKALRNKDITDEQRLILEEKLETNLLGQEQIKELKSRHYRELNDYDET